MKFPVNGWQRTCCAQCLFFGGSAQGESSVTLCRYPRMAQTDDLSEVYMKVPGEQEAQAPEVAAKVNAGCPCFISMDDARSHFRLLMQATTNN